MKQGPLLNMKMFYPRQHGKIKKVGLSSIWRKIKILLRGVVTFPFVLMAVPIIVAIRFLRPVVLIRFGYIFARRIGHFVFDVEFYLCERKTENHRRRSIDLFYYRWGKAANTFFAGMCERQMQVRRWVEFPFFANHWLPGGKDHEVLPAMVRNASRDVDGLFQLTKTQLFFTEEENMQGKMFLNRIGFKRDDKFVCMIVRDTAYLSKYYKRDVSYHKYRDTDIGTYKDAAIALAEKGYWVFRMGMVVQKPLRCDHPRILDYACSAYRSDFLDIWLMGNCFFCISNGTGLDEVPRAFRKPAVYVNYLPALYFVTYDHCISAPKHLVWKDTNRRLTLTEHLVHSYYYAQKYEQEKIIVRDLSPDEIRQAVLEMESKLTGTWQETYEDMQGEARFWEIFKGNSKFHTYHGRIHPKAQVSSTFLRANTEWLN